MSTALDPAVRPGQQPGPPRMSLPAGIWLMCQLELRQRARSRWWLVMLGLWVAAIAGVTMLTVAALDDTSDAALFVFSVIAFVVLGLGMLLAPALSATSINAERAAGTLATVQATLLTPVQITVGKWVAAWLASLVFLAAAYPFLLWAAVTSGTHPVRLLGVVGLQAVLLAVLCGIGIGWSAVTMRPVASVALTYLTAAVLSLGTLVLFELSLPLVEQSDSVTVRDVPPASTAQPPENAGDEDSGLYEIPEDCEETVQTIEQTHTERTWWLLALNPFVVVADAAPASRVDPSSANDDAYGYDDADIFDMIQRDVREIRAGPSDKVDYCWDAALGNPPDDRQLPTSAVWPYGLASHLGLGATGLLVAVRRLRIPAGRLPKGQRIA